MKYFLTFFLAIALFTACTHRNYKYYSRQAATKFQAKDYQGAVDEWSKAINLKSNNAESYKRRGIARYELKDFENALSDLNQAAILNKYDAETYKYLGDVLMQQSNL